MVNTILVPTDGSEHAERAAEEAFALAQKLDARVHILAVADSAVVAAATYTGASRPIREGLEEKAQERVNRLEQKGKEYKLDIVTGIKYGTPAKQIVEYAESNPIDMIIIGTSGRGGVERAIIGSVADQVVRTSPVPVLTIRPEATQATE